MSTAPAGRLEPESIGLRAARRDELALLVEFNLALASETEALELDRARLARGVETVLHNPAHGHYYVYELDQAVVGSLLVTYEWSDWRCGQFWWIQSVYVKPDARRRGVFSAMYGQLATRARSAGAVGLRLYAEVSNTRAHATYLKLGMRGDHYVVFEDDWALHS